MKRIFILCLATVALLSGCATLDERQRAWIFQPSDRSWWRGEEAAAGMSDVWIEFHLPGNRTAGQAARPVAGPRKPGPRSRRHP